MSCMISSTDTWLSLKDTHPFLSIPVQIRVATHSASLLLSFTSGCVVARRNPAQAPPHLLSLTHILCRQQPVATSLRDTAQGILDKYTAGEDGVPDLVFL